MVKRLVPLLLQQPLTPTGLDITRSGRAEIVDRGRDACRCGVHGPIRPVLPGTAATVVVPGTADRSGDVSTDEVIVIGVGAAGLTAALVLARAAAGYSSSTPARGAALRPRTDTGSCPGTAPPSDLLAAGGRRCAAAAPRSPRAQRRSCPVRPGRVPGCQRRSGPHDRTRSPSPPGAGSARQEPPRGRHFRPTITDREDRLRFVWLSPYSSPRTAVGVGVLLSSISGVRYWWRPAGVA